MSAVLESKHLKLTKSEVVYGVSWEMYESLLEKYGEMPIPRLTYDSGILEVEMTNSLKHEENNRTIARLVEMVLLELEVDFLNCGSTTYKRREIRKGFEPDSGFYIKSLSLIEGKTDLDFEKDPPPDLIIEINKTISSLPRMPIFSAFGVKEIWRFNKNQIKFYALEEGVYLEAKMSLALPVLSSERATEFLLDARETNSTAWVKKIREWVATAKIELVK